MSEASAGNRRTRRTTRGGGSSRLVRRALLVCAFAAAGITGAVALAFANPAGIPAGGSTASAQAVAPLEAEHLCARKGNDQLRYVAGPGGCNEGRERLVTLSDDAPLYACASSKSGSPVRRVSGLGKCSSKETGLTLPGEEEVRFCAAIKDGRLRHVTGAAACGSKEIPVFVPPANRAPVADDDSYTVDEDGTLDIPAPGVLDGDTDAENESLATVLIVGPANAESFTLNSDGSFRYEPDADFNGTDTFTYRANDGKKDGNTATVTITVNPVNDAPVAEDDTKSTPENTPLVFFASELVGNDEEGGPTTGAGNENAQNLTVTEVKNPLHGTVVLNSGEITFTPETGYNGQATFEYTVCDDGTPQECSTQTATVNVAVSPANSKPEANAGTETMNEDVAPITIGFDLLVSDNETSVANLTYNITDPAPSEGTLAPVSGQPGKYTFDSADDFNGEVEVSYTVTDRGDPDDCQNAPTPPAQGCDAPKTSDEKTVTITVNPVNDTPDAINDGSTATPAVTTNEDTPTTPIAVLANDTDLGDTPITVTIQTDGAKGEATVNNDNTVTYTPDADANGPDSFVYEVCDADAPTPECDTATVAVAINAINDTPDAINDGSAGTPAATTDEDEATDPIAVLANDTDLGDTPITVTIQTDGAKGEATVNNDNTVTYTPDADANGPDSFVYEVCDADAPTPECDTATVAVAINAINDAPTLDLDNTTGGDDSSATFDEPVTQPGPGAALAPNADVADVDDTNIESAEITLTNRPDGNDESLSVDTTGTTIVASTYDSSTGVLTLTGSASKADYQQVLRTVEYNNTAAPPNSDNRTITFEVNDGDADSAPRTSTVTVVPLNEPPVVDLNGGASGIGYSAAFTEDGGAVSIVDSADPDALTITDADDTELESAEITLTNSPDGNDESLSVDTTGTSITASPYNASTGVLSLSGPDTLANYQQVLRTTTYANSSDTPDTTDREVEFTVNDGQDDSDAATSFVSVAAANDAPVNTVPGAQTVDEDGTKTFSSANGNALSVSDPDAGSNDLQVELSADHAALTLSATTGLAFTQGDGADDAAMTFTGTASAINAALDGLTYAPADDYNGSDTLTIITDDQGNSGGAPESDTDTVAFTVNALNDAPVLLVPASISVDEDVQTALTGIPASDADAGSANVVMTLSVPTGALAATSGGGVTVSGSGTGTLTLIGSVSDINAFIAASNVKFTTAQNATDDVTLTASINDGGNTGGAAETDSETVLLDVQAVNDAPVNTVPSGRLFTGEGDDLAITGISTSDVDAGTDDVKVTLSVTGGANNGALSLNTGTDENTADDNIVIITGTVAEVNAILGDGLTYNNSDEGDYTLTVKTDDQGNTGSGGAKTATDTIDITVDAAPEVTTTNPANNATDAAPGGNITINFSEPVNATNPGSFELKCPSTGTARTFALSNSPDKLTYTLNPDADLPGVTECQVTVMANQVSDTDTNDPPNNMAADHTFTFETAARAVDDTYPQTVTGNVGIDSANILYSVTTNDEIKAATDITFFGFNNNSGQTENGGTVSMTTSGADRGEFTYNPPAGFEGNDHFTYTLAGGSSATVTIPVSGMIWFVNNNSGACSSNCDGRLSNPFTSLSAFDSVNGDGGNNPAAGDNVFVHESSTSYTGGVTLLNNQRLIGQDANASLAAITGLSQQSGSVDFPTMHPSTAPKSIITNTGGNGVTLGQSGDTVRGLTVENTSGSGIKGTSVSGATMGTDVAVSGTNGGAAVDLSGGSGTISYNGTISNTSGGAVSVTGRTGGTTTFGGNINATGGGINAQNNSGSTTVNFSGTTKTLNTGANNAVSLGTNTGATINFTNGNLDIDTTSGTGFSATGGGTVSVAGTNNTINSTGAKALDFSGVTIGSPNGATFDSVSSTGSSTDGIRLDNVAGTFNAAGGSIQNATDQDIDISGNNSGDTVDFTYGGSITDDTGALINVSNQSGGTKDFNGAITDGNDNDGSGISLANNPGATVRFDGGLTLSTGSSNAFSATGGGTVVVTDPTATNNTIATTSGTALNVANTNIGANGLTFEKISAGPSSGSGPTNGIVLNNTGSSGGLKVTGNGDSCTPTTSTCTGGTIQHTGSHGIVLTSTSNVEFNLMSIHDTGDHGIKGDGVNNFTFRDSRIFNFGDTVVPTGGTEDAMIFDDPASTTTTGHGLTGTATIQRSTIGSDGHFVLTPFSPLPTNSGIVVRNWADANLTMNVTGTKFTQVSNDPIDVQIQKGSGTLNVDGSTADGANTFDQYNGGIRFKDSADDDANGTLDLTIKNNTFTDVAVGAEWIADGGTTLNARFNNNTMSKVKDDAVRALSAPGGFAAPGNATKRAEMNTTISGNNMGGGNIYIAARRGGVANVSLGTASASNTGIGNITDSTYANYGRNSVFAEAKRGGRLNIDMLKNTVVTKGGGVADGSVNFQSGNLEALPGGIPNTVICANIKDNNISMNPANSARDIVIDNNDDLDASKINLESFGGGGNAAATTFLTGQNTLADSPPVVYAGTASAGIGDCVTSTP